MTHRARVPRGGDNTGQVIGLHLESLVPRTHLGLQIVENNLITSPIVGERDVLAPPPTYEEATSVTGNHIFRQV